MPAYDRSFGALFRPGRATELFAGSHSVFRIPKDTRYSHANAWWLAECCRLVYRMDDQIKSNGRIAGDIEEIAEREGFRIGVIVSDHDTSSRAAVLQFDRGFKNQDGSMTVVVFCGSNEPLDWKMNLQANQAEYLQTARVHSGFLKCLLSIVDSLLESLRDDAPLYITGHSLGAALATLSSVEFARRGVTLSGCYSFGSPRVGNRGFSELLEGLNIYRLVNNCDIVTSLPVSIGAIEYRHPDHGIFFDQENRAYTNVTEKFIQQRQSERLSTFKEELNLEILLSAMRSLPNELPMHLADHAIINYRHRLEAQLAT